MLGADLNSEIKRTENLAKGDLDIEVLLKGAEKLGEVYHMEGARDRIAQARHRYGRIEKSLRYYEEKVARQARELERMQRAGEEDFEDEMDMEWEQPQQEEEDVDIEELIMAEEEEIRELERKKRELEERVSGMERDLGGLLR